MKKVLSIILSSLAMVSCVDTVLLPDDKTVEEDFWQTKSDVEQMVNGAYAAFATDQLQRDLIVWTSRSDELNVNSAINNNNLNQISSANIQTTNAYTEWASMYSVINNCNLVISKSASVREIDPNYLEGDHLNFVGQMKALRSLCYFYLVRTFRDVPMILEPYKESSQEMNVPQSAPSVVIDQIIADLEEVKNNTLSTQNATGWAKVGYFTRDGVYALLADVYLWKASIYGDEASYDKCIECCNVIRNNRKAAAGVTGTGVDQLDDDGFNLLDRNSYYKSLYTGMGNSNEALFEVQYTDNSGLATMYNKINKSSSYPSFYASKIYSASVSSNDGTSVFYGTNKDKDVRGYESVYGFGTAADAGNNIRKFVATTSQTEGRTTLASDNIVGSRSYTNYDQNWIVYRVSDVVLMKAEAMVQKAALRRAANAGLTEQIAAATTAEDSLNLANQLLEVNKTIAHLNVTAARQAQIINMRAHTDLTADIDSTAYQINENAYDGNNLATFVRRQVNTFDGFTVTANTLETLVMDERARELCFEGKRWFDMLRYNYRHTTGVNYSTILALQGGAYAANYEDMLTLISRKYESGGKAVTAKMQTEPYLYMPIKKSEVEVNPSLIQNPVYNDGATTEKNY